jgi:hypothetical protein
MGPLEFEPRLTGDVGIRYRHSISTQFLSLFSGYVDERKIVPYGFYDVKVQNLPPFLFLSNRTRTFF